MLKVFTLGDFKIEYGSKTLYAKDFNSDMMIKLFLYLVFHRTNAVDTAVICRELWPNGESSNPAGALKNLAYRLRVFFREYYPEEEFIISARGSYSFNPQIECYIDAEHFDELVEKIKFSSDKNKTEKYLMQAVLLYRGDFLLDSDDMRFISIQKAYYHSEYILVAKQLCEQLVDSQRYVELYEICKKIVRVERLEEEIYYYAILSCAYTGNLLIGIEIYEKAVKLLKRELGLSSFSLLNKAYEELLKLRKAENITGIEDLEKLLLSDREPGPFVCEYYEFREIYQLLVRQRPYRETTGMLLLYTLDFQFSVDRIKMERFIAEKIAKAFKEVLLKVLKKGDIVSKCAEYQFIIILGACSPEDVAGVINRIERKFMSDYPQYSEAKILCQSNEIVSIV